MYEIRKKNRFKIQNNISSSGSTSVHVFIYFTFEWNDIAVRLLLKYVHIIMYRHVQKNTLGVVAKPLKITNENAELYVQRIRHTQHTTKIYECLFGRVL